MERTENKIRILDDLVVDQIAAGEVVERPSSVVKELLENALDAGAREISVSILNGGISLIEIKDDGVGMTPEDLRLSIQRFGTSKVRTTDDLIQVSTYGFRGEALPSIASVSALTIISRQRGKESAQQLKIAGGSDIEVMERAAQEGTTVKVENLFYNVPARRKFLKSEKSEANAIKNVVADFALARPDVSFLFYDDGKEVFLAPPGEDLRSRTISAKLVQNDCFSIEFTKNYRDSDKIVEVKGYLNQPLFCPRISSKIRLLVNGRIVKSPLLLRAIRDGYGSYLKPGFYPCGVVSLEIPPEDVDVNVHPQKTEVRFRYESLLFSAVRDAVGQGLQNASESVLEQRTYQIRPDRPLYAQEQTEISFVGNGAYIERKVASDWISTRTTSDFGGERRHREVVDEALFASDAHHEEAESSIDIVPQQNFRFLGQIFKLYLLFEDRDRFSIVDMHAAHERVTFYKLKKAFKNKSIKVHDLLIPLSIPCSEFSESSDLDEKFKALEAFGIHAEIRNDEIIVRSIPDMLHPEDLSKIMLELISSVPVDGVQARIEDSIDHYLARLACHGSVRRGAIIDAAGAYALMDQLFQAENSGWCPHGRPVIWWITEDELEKKFGRVL